MDDRDFTSEIDAARSDPAVLRKIAQDIHEAGGSRLFMIRAIKLARAADSGPHPLGKIGSELGLPRPEGFPLYRYKLAPGIFDKIEKRLIANLSSDLIRPGLAAVFVVWAADWFRRSYQGGTLRWSDIEASLGLSLPQSEWRNLADTGFRAWGIDPLVTAHSNQRLANLARHGGFPAAAIAGGASWPRKFLERAVGEVLGAGSPNIETAVEICERNEYLIPAGWRGQEMQAICGELALKIAELRTFADCKDAAGGRPYSSLLDELYEDWRDELPMMLDGAAAALIDTLLEARKITSGGRIRVERILRQRDGTWRESLDFHIEGRWEDKSHELSPEANQRVFLKPAGPLADNVNSRLAFLEHETAQCWIARAMGGSRLIEFPFLEPVMADFHSRGARLSSPFTLPGGKAIGEGLRVFEMRAASSGRGTYLSLIGQGSGSYRIDQILLDCPSGWTVGGQGGASEIEREDFDLAAGRQLYRCSGEIIVNSTNGDTYLIRTGQSADRKDRLTIFGRAVAGVQCPDYSKLIQHPLHPEVEDGLARRTGSKEEIWWRFKGQRAWQGGIATCGPGECEFGWLDKDTGHLRGKDIAWILPAEFSLVQQSQRSETEIVLSGWDGEAQLGDDTNANNRSWRVRTDPPRRALVPLQLKCGSAAPFSLNVPIHAKEWLTTWDGELLGANTELGLADLRETVARAPAQSVLMGDIIQFDGASLEVTWPIQSELGLSALRGDIATLMRPLGIDTRVKLNFLNGSEDYWFVTEFGNELVREPGGGLSPRKAIVGEAIRICGRYLGAPEKEVDFGLFEGSGSLLGARAIALPRLRGPWLVYLRDGTRILTRPKYVAGDEPADPPQHALGRAMAQPYEMAQRDLAALLESIQEDPQSKEAVMALNAMMELAVSLDGLPPQTFNIFEKFESAELISPLLLYRCEERNLTGLLELYDGLASSWTLLPRRAWEEAFEAQGQFLVERLDDPQWALTRIIERQSEITARMPQLAPLICRDYVPSGWEELREHFTNHTCEGINCEGDIQSPFREELGIFLPDESFASPLMRVFDAPFAAGLFVREKITLNQLQKLTIKDVERRHPDYFSRAYGYALSERKNG
ncbi:MAG: STY4851/ECs_5259 family protein [Sphingomonadaceae bacterium]|nr:STY4851/ECs_5259 family protein [Sphingomonadaceae bacterium]